MQKKPLHKERLLFYVFMQSYPQGAADKCTSDSLSAGAKRDAGWILPYPQGVDKEAADYSDFGDKSVSEKRGAESAGKAAGKNGTDRPKEGALTPEIGESSCYFIESMR